HAPSSAHRPQGTRLDGFRQALSERGRVDASARRGPALRSELRCMHETTDRRLSTMHKVILITGGASGIGAATARLAAAAGYHVAINCRLRADEAAALVSEIERGGGRAVAIAA